MNIELQRFYVGTDMSFDQMRSLFCESQDFVATQSCVGG